MSKEGKSTSGEGAKSAPAAGPGPGPVAGRSRSATIYLGPNRAYNLPLMRGQVFACDGPPPFCKEAIKAHPQLAACFVQVAGAGKACADLQKPDSPMARAVKKVTEESAALRAQAKGGNA